MKSWIDVLKLFDIAFCIAPKGLQRVAGGDRREPPETNPILSRPKVGARELMLYPESMIDIGSHYRRKTDEQDSM